MRPGDRKRRGFRAIHEYGQYIHLGTQFCVSMVIGVLGGWWLDRRLGVLPLFTILGAFLGTAAGTYALYRAVFDRKSR